ncbi:hypothetical protein BH11PAT1_BH11PAT1_5610 [soil metagenome]
MKCLLLFISALIVGFFIMFGLQKLSPKKMVKPVVTKSKKPFSFLNPPSNSLVGNITILTGEVLWESRVATEPAQITIRQKIQQGETLKTGSGSATVQFDKTATFVISSESELDIVQTLPESFVFQQQLGTVEYQRSGITPLSVRVMHLLLDQDVGDSLVGMDTEARTVTIFVRTGKLRLAYNDLDLNTQLQDIEAGKKVVFFDDTREIEIE